MMELSFVRGKLAIHTEVFIATTAAEHRGAFRYGSAAAVTSPSSRHLPQESQPAHVLWLAATSGPAGGGASGGKKPTKKSKNEVLKVFIRC